MISTFNVVMLPSNHLGAVYVGVFSQILCSSNLTSHDTERYAPCHLYFTSDEGLKAGQWGLFPNSQNGKFKSWDDCQPVLATSDYANNGGVYNQKIIATTNPDLWDESCGIVAIPYPFVKVYIHEQGRIARVMTYYDKDFIGTGWVIIAKQ